MVYKLFGKNNSIIIFILLSNKKNLSRRSFFISLTPTPCLSKKSLFTPTEYVFFQELQKQNNKKYVIHSKVRLEDIVGVGKGVGNRFREMRNHIKSRHVDFAILDKAGKILAVIEVDDKSHDTEKAKVGDGYKNDIFEFVGVKFYRVRVGETYAERIENILGEIKGA
jgi:hypothetical protein